MRLLAAALLLVAGTAGAVEMGEDGLYKPDWLAVTFNDVAEDIGDAAADGKRLAIIWEQRGCLYCKKMHEEVFTDAQVERYIRDNYMVVQMNLFGDEEVTDLDGTALPEKQMARRWGITFTPTLMFLPDEVPADAGNAGAAAVATMPGAFSKNTTLNMFRWVREKGYEGEEHFQKYHARMLEEQAAQ